ncbi:MAG: hypothetical protein AB9903_35035 [Vulcanimicrobiota bacterium]
MIVLQNAVLWIFLVFNIFYNLLILIYCCLFLADSGDENPVVMDQRLSEVSEIEMNFFKYGRVEVVRLILATLIQKGFITIKEIEREETSAHVHRPDSSGCPCCPSVTTITHSYKYRSVACRDTSELGPFEHDVLAVFSSYKSAGEAASELEIHPLFTQYLKKMHDFSLIREKNHVEKVIESFYNVSYVLFAAALIAAFFIPVSEWLVVALTLTGMNIPCGIIARLIYYRGKLGFGHISGNVIPTGNYREFIALYEKNIAPIEGSRPFRKVLQGEI